MEILQLKSPIPALQKHYWSEWCVTDPQDDLDALAGFLGGVVPQLCPHIGPLSIPRSKQLSSFGQQHTSVRLKENTYFQMHQAEE